MNDLKEVIRERLSDLIGDNFATYYKMDDVEVEELVNAITDEVYDTVSERVDLQAIETDEDSD